jgi:hypothetical protein
MDIIVEARCSASVLSQSRTGWSMHPRTSSLKDVLVYDTKFLEDYLLAQGTWATREEARAAIVACKHFLFRAAQCPGLNVVSGQVDAVWHAWILHTKQYMAFCYACFGRYVHHVPLPADMPPAATGDARCGIALAEHGHDGRDHCRATCAS